MAKYNIMILERINKDNLVVAANRLTKRQPPTGGSGGHGDGEDVPKPRMTLAKLAEMIAGQGENINNINSRLDRIENRLTSVEQRLGNVEKVLENHSGILERNNLH